MTTQINIKIEDNLKKDVDNILNQLGLSVTDAIRVFFKKITIEKGIPFDMKVKNEITWNDLNEETKNGLLASKKNRKNYKVFENSEKLTNYLNNLKD